MKLNAKATRCWPSTARCLFIAAIIALLCCVNSCDRAAANNSGKIRIEFWTIDLRLRFSGYVNSLITQYESEHPQIDVVWVDVPFTAMVRKYVSAAAAGRTPDVVNLSDGFYARFAALNGLQDLTTLIPGDADETYLPGALRLCRINHKLYGLPWYLATPLMLGNETLLNEGGLSLDTVARNYDGLLKQAEDFHARTGKFLFCPMLGHESELPTKLFEEGLIPFRAKNAGNRIEANLTDPRIITMVQRWVDLYRKGVFPREAATSSHGAIIDLYQNGRVAILFAPGNMLERVRDASPQIFAQTRAGKKAMGAVGKPGMDTMLICVSSQSKHPKEAADFAWFVTNAANQLTFCKQVSILPSTSASLDDPYFTNPQTNASKEGERKILEARAMSARLVREGVNYTPALATWPLLTGVFQEKMKSALTDGRDVKQTLMEINGEWNRILDENLPATMAAVEMGGAR